MGCSSYLTPLFTVCNMNFSIQMAAAIICICAFIQPSVASAYYGYGGFIPSWLRSPVPHDVEPPPHYKEPAPHYEEPTPHYEEPAPHYEEHATHYDEPEPYSEDPHDEHATKETDLDPHGKGKQCVDVSTYTFPKWVKKDKKCCTTVFKKKVIPQKEKVCSKVTSQYCDVLPFTECEMKMHDIKVKVSHWVYKFVPVYKCVKSYEDIIHKKKKPVCTKRPKQVCNSKWKISESGEKVYGGKEDCKTIYVDNCILKEAPEVIKVEKPHCSVVYKAPYMTIETKKDVKTIYKMECKVLKKTTCEAHTTKDCKHIVYNESKDVPHKTCDPTYIKLPKQHLEHKKKCLLMEHNGLNHHAYKLS